MKHRHPSKRASAILLSLTLILILGACTQEGASVTQQVYTKAPNEKSSIRIEYPRFTGDGTDALNTAIYDKVQSFAKIDTDVFPEDTGLTIDYRSAVTLLNDKMVSIVFWGSSNIERAIHPFTDLYSLNIDLQSMQELSFTDLYTVDADFEAIFFAEAYFPTDPVTSYDEASFPEMLSQQSAEFGGVSAFDFPEYITCFLKPEGIVLSMSAIHATGSDHFEAQLDYADIEQFYKPTQKYWED